MIGLDPIVVGSYEACRTARRPTLTGGGGGDRGNLLLLAATSTWLDGSLSLQKHSAGTFFLIFEHDEVI